MVKHATQVGPHGGDACAGGQHDHVGVFIGGQEHFLTHGAGEFHLGARFDVAEEAGAHPVDLFPSFVLVFQLPDAERHRAGFKVVPMAGGGNGIKAQLVGLALGVLAIGDDTDALAFHVVKIAAGKVKADVVYPTNRPFPQEAVVAEDGGHEGILGLVKIHRHIGVGFGVVSHGGGAGGCGWLCFWGGCS